MSKFLHHLAPHCRCPWPVPLTQTNQEFRKGAVCLVASDCLIPSSFGDISKEERWILTVLWDVVQCAVTYSYIHTLGYSESKYRLRIYLAHPRDSLCACALTSSINWEATDAISWNSCYVALKSTDIVDTMISRFYVIHASAWTSH